jgi:GGDEF domain-containing protein
MLAQAQRVLWRAQSGEAEQVLEELDDLLRTADATPYTDLGRLLRYARAVAHHRLDDHEATLQACDALLGHAAATGDRPWMSCAYSLRADALINVGDHDRALADLVTADLLLDGLNRPSFSLATAVNGLAVGYARLGLWQVGLEQFARMEPMLHAVASTALPVFHAYNVAVVHLESGLEQIRLGNTDEAAAQFQKSLARISDLPPLPECLRDKRMQATIDLVLGFCHAYLGDGSKAHELLAPLTDLMAEMGPEYEAGGSLTLARAAATEGRLEEALGHVGRAAEAAKATTAGTAWLRLATSYEKAHILQIEHGESPSWHAMSRYARMLHEDDIKRRQGLRNGARHRLNTERLNDEYRTISRQYLTDGDTGLPNRRGLELRLPELVARSQRHRSWLTLAFVEIVGDDEATPVTPDVLKRVVERAKPRLRSVDIVARSGPAELVFVLPGLQREDLASFLGWLRRRVGPTGDDTSAPKLITGVASSQAPSSVAGLIVAADEALRGQHAQLIQQRRGPAPGRRGGSRGPAAKRPHTV